MADIRPFTHRDGTSEFTCLDCGSPVISFIAPHVALCASCEFVSKYIAESGCVVDLYSARFRREQKE
jgi:hypothetical protein